MKILKHILTPILIFLLAVPWAWADVEDESDTSMTVPGVRSLTLDQQSLHFEPTIEEMINGWTQQKPIIARVSANVGWVLTVRGSSELWEAPWSKPVTDLYWKYDGGEYAPLTTDVVEIVSGGPCNQHTFPVHFMVKLDLEKDVPGEYYYNYIVFELAAP